MSKVTIEEAAKLLEISPQCLRVALQRDKFPFGIAVKQSERRYTYYINRKQLVNYIGGTQDEF